jgi:hypothetical protein
VDLVDEQHVAGAKLVRIAAEVAGPLDDRPAGRPDPVPSSAATMLANVVFPRPGGPERRM